MRVNIDVRVFAFASEFPSLTRERFVVAVRHIALRGAVRGDIYPVATILTTLP